MEESVSSRRRHSRVLGGMEAVFSVIFSGMVMSDDKKYGPIGVVFALMSWLIAIGVVIIWARLQASCGRSGTCHSEPASGNCGPTGARRMREDPDRSPTDPRTPWVSMITNRDGNAHQHAPWLPGAGASAPG
jgi:hypothetical protein